MIMIDFLQLFVYIDDIARVRGRFACIVRIYTTVSWFKGNLHPDVAPIVAKVNSSSLSVISVTFGYMDDVVIWWESETTIYYQSIRNQTY